MKVYAIVKKGKSKGKVFEVLYGLDYLGGLPLANIMESRYKVLAKKAPIYNSKNLEIISEERAKNMNEYMFQSNGNNFFASDYGQIITSAKTQLRLGKSKKLYIYKLSKVLELRTEVIVSDPQ